MSHYYIHRFRYATVSSLPTVNFLYYQIDSTKVDSTLSDFPVGIKITSDTNFMNNRSSLDWQNIHVVDESDNECYVEVEKFDTINKEAVIWVKVPSVSSSVDTILSVSMGAVNTSYVGEPGDTAAQNVWDSDFILVWHMNQDPSGGSGCIIDSTGSNNGTPQGTMTSGDLVDGGLDKAIDFDGSNDCITVSSIAGGSGEYDWTFDFQLDHTSQGADSYLFDCQSGRLGIATYYSSAGLYFYDGGWTYLSAMPSGMSCLSLKFDNSSGDVTEYIDASLETTSSGTYAGKYLTGATTLNGRYDGTNNIDNNTIAEFRISKTTRTDAWIKATHYNLLGTLVSRASIYAGGVIAGIGFSDEAFKSKEFHPVGISEAIGLSDESIEDNHLYLWKYFGTLQNSYEDGTLADSPTLSDYWVSFDGSNDGLYWDDNLDIENLDLHIVFRLDYTDWSDVPTSYEVIWKSGNNVDGFGIAIARDANNNMSYLYVGGRHTGVHTEISFPWKGNLDFDKWYEIFINPNGASAKITIREYDTPSIGFTFTGTITINTADYYESIGYSLGSSPYASSSGYYAKCSVRSIDYYRLNSLNLPADFSTDFLYYQARWGNNHDGSFRAGENGSPVMNDEWVTFDGNDAWYLQNSSGATLIDETDIDIKLTFRLEEDFKDNLSGHYTLWKIGDEVDGFEFGIKDRKIGFVSRNNGTLQTNIVDLDNIDLNVWYEAFLSTSKITIREEATPANGFTQYATVDVNAANTDDYMALASCVGASIWEGSTSSTWQEYTQMSAKELLIWNKGGLAFPSDLSAPIAGPMYRYDFGSSEGGTYGFSSTGSPVTNSDNIEGDGNDALHKSGDYGPIPTSGYGLVVEVSVDTFSSAQVYWKVGDEINGIAIGNDASGNVGVFARSSSSLTSITISASTYLSTATKYFIYANESTLRIYDSALTIVAEAFGSLSVGTIAENISILGYVYGSPITGTVATWGEYLDGRLYMVEVWEQDDLEFPESEWHHVGGEVGFADAVGGDLYVLYESHNFGTNNEGADSPTGTSGAPTQSAEWVTFDGIDDGYYYGTSIDESDINVRIVFRIEEDPTAIDGERCIWKSGGYANGIGIGFGQNLGDKYSESDKYWFGGFVQPDDSNSIALANFEEDVWYEAFISEEKITVRRVDTPSVGFTVYQTLSPGNGGDPESVGYAESSSPISNATSDGGYFVGSVDIVEIASTFNWPADLGPPVYQSMNDYVLGSSYDGWAGFNQTGTPTQNTDNVEFDGTNGLYLTSDWGDETKLAFACAFSCDDFSDTSVFWKSGGYANGIAIGINGNVVGIFGRATSLTSITVSTATLSTGTKYWLYASQTEVRIYNGDLTELLLSNTGTITPGDGGSDESIGYSYQQCPISGSTSADSYLDGKIYEVHLWHKDDITWPVLDVDEVEVTSTIGFADTINGEITSAVVSISEGIGFSDEVDGLNVADTFYTEDQIGFNETVGGEQVATQKEVTSTIGFNEESGADHIDETTGEVDEEIAFSDTIDGYNSTSHKESASTFGLNESVVGRAEVKNKEQQSTLGLSDEAGAYNAVNHVGSISTLGLNDEVGGTNIITRKESASTLGLNDSANVNLEQEVGASEQIAFNETVGEISVRNVGFSSQLGLNGAVLGGNPLSPDNEGEIGFNDEIGATYYPVKSISEEIGFSDSVGVVRAYEVGCTNTIGFNDSSFGENAGNLIPYHPANMRYKFYLTLTGANDSLDDYEITQLKTIQFRMKSGEESSYLGISAIYSEEKETAIDARLNGTLILEMESVYEGVTILRETLMEVDFSDVRYDIGSNSRSITINGYGALTYTQDVSYLVNAIFKRVNQDGRISYRFPRPDFYLRPGWTAVYGVEKFTVDEVAFMVGENSFEMDVYFEPETLTGANDNDIYVRRWFPTYRERKLYVTLTGSADAVEDYTFENVFHLEIRKKAGAASYASVTLVYTKETGDAITARPNGDIRIDVQDGLDASVEELLTVNFNNLSYQFLQKSRTVTIAGFKQVPYVSGVTYTPTNVIAERVDENGDYYIRSASPNVNIKPGCTVSYGGKVFIAGKVSFNFASQSEWMEVSNIANIDVDRHAENELGITGDVVSNTFYRTNHSESTFGVDNTSRVSFNDVENAPATSEIGFNEFIAYELNPIE